MTTEEADALAAHIVNHIFDIGVEYGTRPNRMGYKVIWRGVEVDAGGLCESAMIRYASEAIRTFESTQRT